MQDKESGGNQYNVTSNNQQGGITAVNVHGNKIESVHKPALTDETGELPKWAKWIGWTTAIVAGIATVVAGIATAIGAF